MRSPKWAKALASVGAALVLFAAPSSASPRPHVSAWEHRMVNLINSERHDHGLGPLRIDPNLVAGARDWSEHMVRVGYIYHDPQRLRRIYPNAHFIAENVAECYDCSADYVFNLYMHSPPHRANILSPHVHYVGVGHYGADDTIDETDRPPQS